MLGHKTSSNKFKIEIMPSIFFNHDSMKLKITNRRKMGKFTYTCKLNKTFLNYQWVKEESQRILENILRQMKTKKHCTKNGRVQETVLGGKYIVVNAFIKKEERSQINSLSLYLKKRGK